MILSAVALFSGAVFAKNSETACSYSDGTTISMYSTMLAQCAGSAACIDYEDDNDNNGRRRLEDDDEMLQGVAKYQCYCSNCADYVTKLQEACNACDVPNYCEQECDDDGDCACAEQEEGQTFFQAYCMIDNLVVMNHGEDLCTMLSSTSSECLTEMEYLVNPPEQQDDDDDNNGRRLLKDDEDEEEIDAGALASCWASAFTGASADDEGNQLSLDDCATLCTSYANRTYDYMSQDVPAQTCGLEVQYLGDEDTSLASAVLPHAQRLQGVLCVSSSCSSDDLVLMTTVLNNMARYAQFINFEGEEGQNNNNNNNNNNNDEEDGEPYYAIPETQLSWKCDGAGDEGALINDNIPDECAVEEDEEDSDDDIFDDIDEVLASEGGPYLIASVVLAGLFLISCGAAIYYARMASSLKNATGLLENNPTAAYQSSAGNNPI